MMLKLIGKTLFFLFPPVLILTGLVIFAFAAGFIPEDIEEGFSDASETLKNFSTEKFAVPRGALQVRFISDEWICVAGDYNDFLNDRIFAEERIPDLSLPENAQYKNGRVFNFAAFKVISKYRPQIVKNWNDLSFFTLRKKDGGICAPADFKSWLNSAGLFRLRKNGIEKQVVYPAVMHFAFFKLPAPMRDGEEYTISTKDGDSVSFVWHDKQKISRALKVNQVGYHPDAGRKYAYLNMWMGPGRTLPVEQWEGREFFLIRESDGKEAFRGNVKFRSAEQYHSVAGIKNPVNGGSVMELEFSSFREEGKYHIYLPGIGRSWSFRIGNDALGEAFYTHARGLYHARCGTPKTHSCTVWEIKSCHEKTRQGGFSPDDADYDGNAKRDGGYYDKLDKPLKIRSFTMVEDTATDQILPGVSGGWHDAGDFDRRNYHLRAAAELMGVYLLFPNHFSDSQLNLPESGNGIPDILDEVLWGMEVWRKAQQPDGGVGTWIEADSHPKDWNPETDRQKYYLALATRTSTMEYAAHAALLARILKKINQDTLSKRYADSARKAFRFAADPKNRAVKKSSRAIYREPSEPDMAMTFKAALNLEALYPGEPEYTAVLTKQNLDEFFKSAPWPRSAFYLAEFADPEIANRNRVWAEECKKKLILNADHVLARQEKHAFRTTTYEPGHGFFQNLAWGNANPLRCAQTLMTAYAYTGDAKYRDGAYLANDFLMGANPMGISMTTGLGTCYPVRILHLPSYAKQWQEPPPGITPYFFGFRVTGNASKLLYGLFTKNRRDWSPIDEHISLIPELPSAGEAEIRSFLAENYPVWHRYDPLESYSVELSEFTIWETVSESAAATGALLAPGWVPTPDLKMKRPVRDVRDAPGYIIQP